MSRARECANLRLSHVISCITVFGSECSSRIKSRLSELIEWFDDNPQPIFPDGRRRALLGEQPTCGGAGLSKTVGGMARTMSDTTMARYGWCRSARIICRVLFVGAASYYDRMQHRFPFGVLDHLGVKKYASCLKRTLLSFTTLILPTAFVYRPCW